MTAGPRALWWALLLAAPALAQTPAEALQRFLAEPRLRGARIGVQVVDLRDGKVLASSDADKGFMTASNMKLITAAVALYTLGPEFRFQTTLALRGSIAEGVVDGDLVLVGSGDPTLGGRQEKDGPRAPFARMAQRLKKSYGIIAVHGDIIGDDRCQPDEGMGEGWSWGYQGACYAAWVSGLCFAENCVQIRLRGTVPGRPPAFTLIPKNDLIRVTRIGARTVAKKGPVRLSVRRLRARNEISVRGTIPRGAKILRSFSVEHPSLYAASVLLGTLAEHGIEVTGRARGAQALGPGNGTKRRVLAMEPSPPLSEILVTLLKKSQNLYAEQLIRAASRKATGRSSMQDAQTHAKKVLEELGVNTSGMVIADGSGLTRLDLVKPAQLASLLIAIWNGPHRDLLVSALPIAGVDGTLEHRFKGSVARGRVHAKTGYISRVVALSGYASPIAFSILINNFTCSTADAKAAVDRFVVGILPPVRNSSRGKNHQVSLRPGGKRGAPVEVR